MPRGIWAVHGWCRRRDCACRSRTLATEARTTARADDSLGDVIRRALGMDGGNDQKAIRTAAYDRSTRVGATAGNEPGAGDEKPDRRRETTSDGTTDGTSPNDDDPNRRRTTRRRAPAAEPPWPEPGQPPGQTDSSAAAAVAVAAAPSSNCLASRHRRSPEMQLPDELTPGEPGGPAGRLCSTQALRWWPRRPVGAAAPIVLPVIVAPPIGLGGGRRRRRITGDTAWPAPRRHRRVARRTRPAAGQRGQQRRARLVLPDRIHRISANRRTAAGRGLGSARNCGHSCTHRCRGISRVPPGEGGPRGAGGWHSTLHQVTDKLPPRTGVGSA